MASGEPGRLPFDATDGERAAVREQLARDGLAVLRPSPAAWAALGGARDAYAAVALLTGLEPWMAERQVIRPLPGGRSFAAGRGPAPLHTDSQRCRGLPPHLLVMLCERASDAGGDTLLCDGHALLRRALASPAGLRELAGRRVAQKFYFGTFDEAFANATPDGLHVTCPPGPPPWVTPWLRVDHRFRLAPGDVLLLDNHRVVHGREPFDGETRAMTRVLAWLPAPLSVPADLREAVLSVARPGAPAGPPGPRVQAVLELLRGGAPGPLAARLGVDEADLYALRDKLLDAAQRALGR